MDEEQVKYLIMMVGLPRSGKTTLACQTNYPIVNPDAIRLALHGSAFISEAEPMVWTIATYMVRSLFLSGHSRVILDATNTTRKRREEWKSEEWKRVYWVVPTSKEMCRSRAQADDKDYLLPVIDRMYQQIEPIDPEEGNLFIDEGLTEEQCQSLIGWMLGGDGWDPFYVEARRPGGGDYEKFR